MTKKGYNDWGINTEGSLQYNIDPTESLHRLDEIKAQVNLGTIQYSTDFSEGLFQWRVLNVFQYPLIRSTILQGYYKPGAYALGDTPNLTANSGSIHPMPIVGNGLYGLECLFAMMQAVPTLRIGFILRDSGTQYESMIKFDNFNHVMSYHDPDNTYHTIMTIPTLNTGTEVNWHLFRMVYDSNQQKIVRLWLDDTFMDILSYPVYSSAIAGPTTLSVEILSHTVIWDGVQAYITNLIVTSDEPEL